MMAQAFPTKGLLQPPTRLNALTGRLMLWEKEDGRIGLNEKNWRELFPPTGEPFTLYFGSEKLERSVKASGRLTVGRRTLGRLEPGDVLVCYRDENGDYHIDRSLKKDECTKIQG